MVFFKRHNSDDPSGTAPGHQFLADCPTKVEATMFAVLEAVAAAPPMRFAGGGHREAMHGSMTGWFEVRVDGSKPRAPIGFFAGSTTTPKAQIVLCSL